jgi:biotin carboxylase
MSEVKNGDIVWFNSGISSLAAAALARREARLRGDGLRFVAETTQDIPLDGFRRDPRLLGRAYAERALNICERRGISLLVPQRNRIAVAAAAEAFAGAGIALSLPGTAEAMRLAERKDLCSEALARAGVRVPTTLVVRSADELDEAVRKIRSEGAIPCLKPVSGIGGRGFRLLLLKGEPRPAEWLPPGAFGDHAVFLRKWSADPKRKPLLACSFLPGKERSVDCLAHRGKLVVSVTRRKDAEGQISECDGSAAAIAAVACETLGMTGLFNVQTKDDAEGRPALVEVNARMSGGLAFSCAAGCCLPYWAARLALGTASPEDVPKPRGGTILPSTDDELLKLLRLHSRKNA